MHGALLTILFQSATINGQPAAGVALDGQPAISAAQAPVRSVNALTGAVTVPGTMRASCTVSSFDPLGVGACNYGGFTGGTAFTAIPDCFAELTAVTGYVYAYPLVQRGMTSATVTVSAAPKVLTVSLGALTIYGAPPAGTSLTVICRGQ